MLEYRGRLSRNPLHGARGTAFTAGMEKVPYLGANLTRWRIGQSTFLAWPEKGARLMNWNVTLGDGSVRDVLYWPELNSLDDFPRVRGGNPIADDLIALGVPVDYLSIPHLRDLTALPRLLRYLKETQADLVHTQLEFANILGTLAARGARLPSVCTVHTIPSQEEMRAKTRLHQNVEFFCLRNFCDMVISVSEEAQRFHRAVGRMSERKTSVIYNGIDLARFSAETLQADPQAVRRPG